MSRKLFIVMILVLLVSGGYGWWQLRHTQTIPHAAAPQTGAPAPSRHQAHNRSGHRNGREMPAPIQAAQAVSQNVPYYLTGLGTVTAANTVTVRSRIDGQLMAIHFTEGQPVKAGQLLAEIDPRPYQVALAQAEGQLAKDRASLVNAHRDLARYQRLAKTSLVSRQTLDTQYALVSETAGIVKVDEASVASAKLNLEYCRVTAPIDGRTGLKQVDAGNYITNGDSHGLVVITQTQPTDVLFTLPENNITDILRAQKNRPSLLTEVWDRSNKTQLAAGRLLSLDNQIDPTTGTIKLKARFTNQDNSLFPNQFVNVRLKVHTLQHVVVIPAAALQQGNENHFVWVVSEKKHVSKKVVTPGIQNGHQVVISAGLDAGEYVVTDGIDRLTEGAVVEVIASKSPTPSAIRTPTIKEERG
ncbi:MdtA/MuxA family multidrug efflux RND transporter periplasmic adaptor subunit [Enterobacteriaceae bacterium LUAb1]